MEHTSRLGTILRVPLILLAIACAGAATAASCPELPGWTPGLEAPPFEKSAIEAAWKEAGAKCAALGAKCRSESPEAEHAACTRKQGCCNANARLRYSEDLFGAQFNLFCARHAFSAKNGACTWDRSAGGWPPKGRSKGEQRLRFLGASGSPRMITKADCGVLEPSRKLGQPHPDPPADPCE